MWKKLVFSPEKLIRFYLIEKNYHQFVPVLIVLKLLVLCAESIKCCSSENMNCEK